MEVHVEFEFLRRLVVHDDRTALHVLVERQSQPGGVACDLRGMLIERDEQPLLSEAGAFHEVLHAEQRLAGARDPDHESHRTVEHAIADHLVDCGDAERRALHRRGLFAQCARPCLRALEDPNTLAGFDAKRVAAGDEILAARLRDLERAHHASPARIAAKRNDRVANEVLV